MSTSDRDQPQAQDQEQTRGGDSQSHASEGGADRASGRHDGGGDRGRRRRGGAGGGGRPPQQQSGQSRRSESSLNMDELRELTELFTTHALTEFEFENADIRVRLSRAHAPQAGSGGAQTAHAPTLTASSGAVAGATQTPSTGAGASSHQHAFASPSETTAAGAGDSAEDLHVITSPIVGTFYRAASPTSEVFVRAGSHVEPDTVVCIIEAMKLMNEIQAETTGTVEKIYVENGQPVEYGQPLFGVKK